jgi:LysM repeat protein
MKSILILSFTCLFCWSCSPLKSSPDDEKHKLELTLHEVQTNLDDAKHDISCFQTDLRILEDRMRQQEQSFTSLKKETSDKLYFEYKALVQKCAALENQIKEFKLWQEDVTAQIKSALTHANEITTAISQHQKKLSELHQISYKHSQRFQELSSLKKSLELIINNLNASQSTHVVSERETLEKIARKYHLSVDRLKRANHLEKDIIYPGQKLIIPQS